MDFNEFKKLALLTKTSDELLVLLLRSGSFPNENCEEIERHAETFINRNSTDVDEDGFDIELF